ncbi:hypothetical protein AB0M22_09405 [Nocardia sp. NPDC051756]|uniref:hypothetical protein n=1 Tax=Nocardia sp. NPDC051756 TaxID=3154751 RepID=UPI00342CD1EC
MTTLLIILAALVANLPLAILVAKAIHKEQPRSTNSLGAATPHHPAAEGTGARPASESGGISPCAVPPQDASRPNPHYRPDPDSVTFQAMRADQMRFMAEQVEATTYDNEVQP